MSDEDKADVDAKPAAAEDTEKPDVDAVETDDVDKLKESNRRLFERAKKAEAKLKDVKPAEVKPTSNATQSVDSEELKLIARGLSDEEIEKAKVIAKGEGVSLTQAIKSDLFVLYQDKLKSDAKKEKAKLGAASGSSSAKDESFKPGQTRDEHKEAWKKAMAG